jgi:hypothetical protein
MTFGGAPCPALWGIISDTIADSCNALIHNPHWDHELLFDQLSASIADPMPLPRTMSFTPAQELAMDIPINDIGKVDMYIDDTIGVALDLANNTKRAQNAMPLIIHAFARPLDSSESTPRLDLISLKKFQAEGKMEEVKTVLGWIINTRSLSISLPVDKYSKWSSHIKEISSASTVNSKQLETLLGRLNHVASIQAMLHHFLGR